MTPKEPDMRERCEKIVEEIHEILDGDASKIIRNAKDGYPEGRPDRVLTLAERVKALCKYAADWKRWCLEREKEIEELKNVARSSASISERQMYEIADLQEKLKAAEYCLNEVYDVLRMTYTEESATPLLVKQTLQKISEV